MGTRAKMPYSSKAKPLHRADNLQSLRSIQMPQKKLKGDAGRFTVTLHRDKPSIIKCRFCSEVKFFDYPFDKKYEEVLDTEILPFKKLHEHDT